VYNKKIRDRSLKLGLGTWDRVLNSVQAIGAQTRGVLTISLFFYLLQKNSVLVEAKYIFYRILEIEMIATSEFRKICP
jgi:hypothetical protein